MIKIKIRYVQTLMPPRNAGQADAAVRKIRRDKAMREVNRAINQWIYGS